eukprot:2199744-Lingulodinium_polyedra.AAC.1
MHGMPPLDVLHPDQQVQGQAPVVASGHPPMPAAPPPRAPGLGSCAGAGRLSTVEEGPAQGLLPLDFCQEGLPLPQRGILCRGP